MLPKAISNPILNWRDCLFVVGIVFMMIAGGVGSSLLAMTLEARLAHQCYQPKTVLK